MTSDASKGEMRQFKTGDEHTHNPPPTPDQIWQINIKDCALEKKVLLLLFVCSDLHASVKKRELLVGHSQLPLLCMSNYSVHQKKNQKSFSFLPYLPSLYKQKNFFLIAALRASF